MAKDTNNSAINPGDSFQQRPTDAQAEGQPKQVIGQIGLSFDSDGDIEYVEFKGSDTARPHPKVKIIENETEPGEFVGTVLFSSNGQTAQTERDGQPVETPCYDGVSVYTRHDPERQRRFKIDTETGQTADVTDPKNPVIVIDGADPDAPNPTPRTMLDAFSRRQDKSLAHAARAAMETARMYPTGLNPAGIERAFSEASARFQDAIQTAITPAIRAAAQMAQGITPAMESTVEKAAQIIGNMMPVIDTDVLRTIGKSLQKLARENLIFLTMYRHWKDVNGGDLPDVEADADALDVDASPTDDDATTPEANSVIEALRILAAAYSETHDDFDAIISDDGTSFELPAEADAEIRALIEEYSAFHNEGGAESYVFTARLFAKTHFQPPNPNEIIVSDRLTAISLQDFQFALTTRPNPTAFIAPLGTGAFTRFKYDEKTQQVINVKTGQPVQETQTPVETASMMKQVAETVTTPDFVLLTALYSVLLSNAERFEGDNIIVPMQAFSKVYGIDISAGHAKDLEKKFSVYEPYVGWINGQGLFAVLKFIKRDDVNGTMTFSAPYLNRLLSLVQQKGTRTYRSGRKTVLAHNQLVHSTIYSERNQTAAAVVIHICDLLLQNSQRPAKGEPYVIGHIAFSTLADYAELAPRIERTTATREKSRILKSCFTKALELLRTKSDAYQYFDGLELYVLGKDRKTKTFATIRGDDGTLSDNLTSGKEKYNAIAPTFANYNDVLFIRHRGAKKNWKHDD